MLFCSRYKEILSQIPVDQWIGAKLTLQEPACDIHLCDLERRLFNGMREFHDNRLSKSHECDMLDPRCVRSETSH